MVDFNVKGKPNPPPVNLLLKIGTLQYLEVPPSKAGYPVGVFTDPSGTIGAPTLPLNMWYGLPPTSSA